MENYNEIARKFCATNPDFIVVTPENMVHFFSSLNSETFELALGIKDFIEKGCLNDNSR